MTFAFNNFKHLHEDFQRVKEAAEFAKRKKTLAKIKELDTGNGVPMDTFLLAVLEQLGVLDRERDLEPWIKVSMLILCNVLCCTGRSRTIVHADTANRMWLSSCSFVQS